jgi:AraC-like DNA-binding protein
MSYREHRVGAWLGSWVECAWERTGGGGDRHARIVPDGCMDLIWSEHNGLTAVGPNTTAFVAPLDPGRTVVGVRLHPGAGPPLFGLPGPALRDGRIAASELWGDSAAALELAVAEAVGASARVGLLTEFLARRARVAGFPDPVVRAAAARLERARVSAVAGELGVSERHLRRVVEAEVGYGPKRLGRVLRLRRALARVRAGAELAEVAFAGGYADQAHFARDCRELAGVPPGRFVQDSGA